MPLIWDSEPARQRYAKVPDPEAFGLAPGVTGFPKNLEECDGR